MEVLVVFEHDSDDVVCGDGSNRDFVQIWINPMAGFIFLVEKGFRKCLVIRDSI